MATTAQSKAAAEAVKVEANTLYQAGKFKEAYAKYGEAIALDDTNATLFANRAACSLKLNEYLNAACDARKATNLDPKYIKAWARLAKSLQAFGAYDKSAVAWESALACYPENTPELSESEMQIKTMCEAGLRQAQRHVMENPYPLKQPKDLHKRFITVDKSDVDRGLMPWQKAKRMIAGFVSGEESSAWVIFHAHCNFETGCNKMFQTIQHDNGTFYGPVGALVDTTNALLRDTRTFTTIPHTFDIWLDTFLRQLNMEAGYYGCWWLASESGAAEVQKHVLALQQEEGFYASSIALSITIRAWFMIGYIAESITGNLITAMQYYRNIVAVLEWGIETWKGVPDAERGEVLSDTFVRGMRRQYLRVYAAELKRTNYCPTSLGISTEDLDKLAEQLIAEARENMPKRDEEYSKEDPGFKASFFVYPLAEACAIRGSIAYASGTKYRKEADSARANEYFTQAKEHYLAAVSLLPKDEEIRLMHLNMLFNTLWSLGEPIATCLECAQTIDEAKLSVSKLWDHSGFKKSIDASLVYVYGFKAAAHACIAQGMFAADSPASMIELYIPKSTPTPPPDVDPTH